MTFSQTALCVCLCLAAALAVPTSKLSESTDDVIDRSPVVRRWVQDGKLRTAHLNFQDPSELCDNVTQHSGYFTLGDSDKKYFYWFFESRNDPSSDPTIMWLTGGPGCSSMLALLAENGPCAVNSDGATTTTNPYSWNTQANMLYVDQPPGTGFSEGTYDHDEAGVGHDMYQFLQAFFGKFPQYNKRFFVFGESFAGHYVPAVSHAVWAGNQAGQDAKINLEGLAIGNGLTDPEIQYSYYADMAYNSTMSGAPSLISKTVYTAMKAALPPCTLAISMCQKNHSLACSVAFEICNLAETTPVQATGINPYDMRIKCEYGNLCYNFTRVDEFLNRDDVQAALGVNKKWESCNMLVNTLFRADWMHNYQTLLPDMLDDNIRVLIYAGDKDFVCNWLGNKAWVLDFAWSGKEEMNAAEDKPWMVESREAGLIRTAQHMSFLRVYDAGHMVPMDQPEAALDMVNAFLADKLA